MVTIGLLAASVGYWHLLSDRRQWPAESVPLVLCSSIISVLYVAALLGILRPAAYGVIVAGVVALLIQRPRISRSPDGAQLPGGIAVSIAVFAWIAWKLQDATFVDWDVFSHWGLVSKEIASTHALIAKDSTVLFKDYPPGAAIFHYFMSLGAGFSESRALISQALLICAATAALLIGRPASVGLAVFGFVYLAVFTFVDHGFQNLNVDHLLALFFGCGLGSYYLSTDPDRVWRVVPVAFALPLLKSAGMLLAIFLVLSVAFDQLLFNGRRALGALLILAAMPFVANATWKAHVSSLDAGMTFKVNVSASELTAAFSGARATADQRLTIERFSGALGKQVIGALSALSEAAVWARGWTLQQWASLFAGIVVILCIVHWKSGGQRRLLLAVGWLCALAVAYSVGLLVMYLFSFGPYEGTRLASYSRYMGILVLSILTVILAWALSGIDEERWRGSLSRLVTGGLVVTMACLTVPEAYQFFQTGPASMFPLRRQIRRLTRPAIKSTPPNARIYVLAFGSKGLAGYIARYELAPRVVNKGCFEIGTRRFPDDEWTCAMSVDQIRDVLREYDFVLLGPVDEIFWREFGSLFAGRRDSTLFEVDKGGVVQLVAR